MGHYVELQVGRRSSPAWQIGLDGPDFPLTFAKEPRIAELMLFDASSLQLVEGRRDLISARASAVERFRRRLPQVRAALRFEPLAGPLLTAFGEFFAAIDWPYVRLDTGDYRLVLGDEEQAAFDRELEFALGALDQSAIAAPGQLFGGSGRYTPEWERLINLVRRVSYVEGYRAVDAIYNADKSGAAAPLCGTAYYWPEENKPGNLLAAYLPRHGALTIPHIARAKALLGVTPRQQAVWQPVETALRAIALGCVERVRPAEPRRPLGADDLAHVENRLVTAARPLLAMLSMEQKRIAARLLRAMGFALARGP
jgi:hypothetical protein